MKKLRLILSLVCLVSLGLFSYTTTAQISKGGLPPSFALKKELVLSNQAQKQMPINFDIKELLEEDNFNAQNGINVPRIAVDIPTNISMDNSGEWIKLPDGKNVWRVAVEAKGAKAIILSYDDFYLPEGSKLFIYNKEHTQVLGAFDNTTNPRGGAFSTSFVAGDVAILEYVPPISTARDEAKIKISGVGYAYNHINITNEPSQPQVGPGSSRPCQVNVICSPEGDLWQENSKSVCQLIMLKGKNWNFCSGTLVNNTANDMTPYILSADHCQTGATHDNFAKWQFNFFFKSNECAKNVGYEENKKTLVGAELLVNIPLKGGSDGMLLRLKNNIPGEWIANNLIKWAGWDRRADASVMAKSGVCISHPSADIQKIATYPKPAEIVGNINFGNDNITAENAHWRATFTKTKNGWGSTEGGSSGSGLINQDGLVIGTLSGGMPGFDCTDAKANLNASDYGAMFFHWDQYGKSNKTQMKNWLDPINGGTAEICQAYPSSDKDVNFTGDPSEIYALQSVKFGAMAPNADSILWEFDGGEPAKSKELLPTVTYNTPGKFKVKLTIYTKKEDGKVTSQTIEKAEYIIVTEKGNEKAEKPNAYLGVFVKDKTVVKDDFMSSSIGTEYTSELLNGNVEWKIDNKSEDNQPIKHGYEGAGDKCAYYKSRAFYHSARIHRKFDLTPNENYELSFQYLIRQYASMLGNYTDNFYVEYRQKDGDEWTLLYSSNKSTCQNKWKDKWEELKITLPKSESGKFQIAFRVNSYLGLGVAVDNITIDKLTVATKLNIWEEDVIRIRDLSTGVPVFYKYTFDGGDPESSESEAPYLDVKYKKAGEFNVSQWVKNTKGEDKKTRAKYVKVNARKLEVDKKEIKQLCANTPGDAFTDKIKLTANKNWKATAPNWITLDVTSGTVTTPGDDKTFTIDVAVAANPTANKGRSGSIKFTTDDGIHSISVKVFQATEAPTALKATTDKDVNVNLSWKPVPNTYIPPLGNCNVAIKGGGTFENKALYNSNWTAWAFGNIDPALNPNGWDIRSDATAKEGGSFMISASYINNKDFEAVDANNWLITPKLKPNKFHNQLTFWVSSKDVNYLDSYAVKVLEASALPNKDTTSFVVLHPLKKAPGVWTEVTVDLSDYNDKEVFVAFQHRDKNQYLLKIDNVSGVPLADCSNTTENLPLVQTKEPEMLNSNQAVIYDRKIIDAEDFKLYEEEMRIEKQKQRTIGSILQVGSINASAVASTQSNAAPLDIASLKQFKWCGDYGTVGIGASGKTFKAAAKWAGEDLKIVAGAIISAIEIALAVDAEIELFIMEGGVEVYTQKIPKGKIPLNKPYIATLTKPFTIKGESDVYIGYTVTNYEGFAAMTDVGPKVSGKGNLLYWPAENKWYQMSDLDASLNFNWYIIAYGEGVEDGYTVYRQRKTGTNNVFKPIASGLSEPSFVDKNVRPGGEYCYKVTYRSDIAESCATDEQCVFVLYQQKIDSAKLIKKRYGNNGFKIDAAATDGNTLRSTADAIDYFKGRNRVPVSLAIAGEDNGVIELTGTPGSYNVKIKKAGDVKLVASQAGIPDSLLPAKDVFINIKVALKNLLITANNKERDEGEENPSFDYTIEGFVYSENESIFTSAPTLICEAKPTSPMGKYVINVDPGVAPNYDIKTKAGILTINRSDKDVNIFTPYAADGYNDYFMAGHKIKVFNRAGVLIYETANTQELANGWNGKVRQTQKMAEPGVYYFYVVDENGKTLRNGSVNLVK